MLVLRTSSQNHIGYFEAIVYGDNFREYLNIIKNVPSRSWDKRNKVWYISISDYDILMKGCEKRGLRTIDISEDLKRLLTQYRKWEFDIKSLVNKEDSDFPIDPASIKIPLMPHQKVALEFFLTRKIGLNASEMGTGKTFPALLTAKYLYDKGLIKSCLVVCIASVKWNWAKEIEKCLNDATFTVIEGTPEKRVEGYMSKSLFKIVNYEVLRNDIEPILYDTVFDCIIVDEIHRIRTYNAKQTKALYALGKNAQYRFGLTGTPIQNKLNDLFSIMKFIHPHLFGDWFAFDRRYVIRGYFGEISDYHNLQEVHDKLKTIMFRRLKSEVLKDLPPKVYNDMLIELSPNQRKFYNSVRDQILESRYEEVEDKINAQGKLLANITFLREVCDSCELIDPDVKTSSKIQELKKIVAEILENGHKVVIFSQFKRMIYIIERELKLPAILLTGDVDTGKGIRESLIEEFHTSKDKNIFLMTTAGSEGVNLQCADYVILFDLPFNPQVMAQVEDRLHRKGQKNTVNVIRLLAKDTIEDRVLDILKFKTKLFKEVVDGLTGKPVVLTQKELLDAIQL